MPLIYSDKISLILVCFHYSPISLETEITLSHVLTVKEMLSSFFVCVLLSKQNKQINKSDGKGCHSSIPNWNRNFPESPY